MSTTGKEDDKYVNTSVIIQVSPVGSYFCARSNVTNTLISKRQSTLQTYTYLPDVFELYYYCQLSAVVYRIHRLPRKSGVPQDAIIILLWISVSILLSKARLLRPDLGIFPAEGYGCELASTCDVVVSTNENEERTHTRRGLQQDLLFCG